MCIRSIKQWRLSINIRVHIYFIHSFDLHFCEIFLLILISIKNFQSLRAFLHCPVFTYCTNVLHIFSAV